MGVNIKDPEFLKKFAVLETPRWSYSWDPKKVSEEEAKKLIEEYREDLISEMSDPDPNMGGHDNGYVTLLAKAQEGKKKDWDFSLGVLYGRGGWNRYRVDQDGNVSLLPHSVGDKRYLQEAEKLGFTVG